MSDAMVYGLSVEWIVRGSAHHHVVKIADALRSLRGMRCCGQEPDPRCLRCGDIDAVIAGLESGEQWAAHDALDHLSFGSADDWPASSSRTNGDQETTA